MLHGQRFVQRCIETSSPPYGIFTPLHWSRIDEHQVRSWLARGGIKRPTALDQLSLARMTCDQPVIHSRKEHMSYIPISIFFAGLIVWNTVDRIIYSRKRREWVEVKAIVRSVVSKPVGEFPELGSNCHQRGNYLKQGSVLGSSRSKSSSISTRGGRSRP